VLRAASGLTITSVNPPIAIQPPRRFQGYVWLYSVTLGAFCVLFLVEGFARGANAAAIAFVPLGGLIGLGFRAMRLRALADSDALLVCNWLSTHRFSRSSIREFRMGEASTASGGTQSSW
jgi:hypothetical protein